MNFRSKESAENKQDKELKISQEKPKEINKIEVIMDKAEQFINEKINSSKSTRPSKFIIINNNINNANIIIKKSGNNKKNSLFDNKRINKNNLKSIIKSSDNCTEIDKNKVIMEPRNSNKRNAKYTVKVYNNGFNRLKMFSNL